MIPATRSGPHDEHLAMLPQVAGEEDDHRELAELRRLEGDRADVDAEVGAVDLRADPGDARQEEQEQPAEHDQVAVALEHEVVLEEDDRRHEQDQPDDEPVGLIAGEGLVDPVEHHQPDGGQQRDEREQVGVGVGEPDAQEDVRAEADGEEVGAEDQAGIGELVAADDEDRGEAGDQQAGDRDQPEQLPVPCAQPPPPPGAVADPTAGGVVVTATTTGALDGRRRLLRRRRALEVGDQRLGVIARAQVVVDGDPAAILGELLQLDRAHVLLGVELDPERKLVGKAAVEGDLVGVVDAEEPDLPGADDRADADHADHEQCGEPLQQATRPAPRCRRCGAARGDGYRPAGSPWGCGASGGRVADGVGGEARAPRRSLRRGWRLRHLGGDLGGLEPEEDDGDVVAAAAVVGGADQPAGGPLEVALAGPQDRDEVLVVEHRRQPVGAEQEDVARAGADGHRVDVDVRLGAERPRDHRPLRVLGRLVARQLALAPQLLDQRVVVGDLLELALTPDVGATLSPPCMLGSLVARQLALARSSSTSEWSLVICLSLRSRQT